MITVYFELQSHFIYGPVSHRKDDTSSGGCTVDSYLKYVVMN